MVDKIDVGLRMTAIRLMLSRTQEQWAAELEENVKNYKIARTNVSKWEGGAAFPPEDVYVYLYRTYRISTDWILDEAWEQLKHGDVEPLKRALAAAESERSKWKRRRNGERIS